MKSSLYLLLSIFAFLSCSDNDSNFEPQNETDILKYIKDNNLDATKSSSGLYYVIDNEGNGCKTNKQFKCYCGLQRIFPKRQGV